VGAAARRTVYLCGDESGSWRNSGYTARLAIGALEEAGMLSKDRLFTRDMGEVISGTTAVLLHNI
jgi:hypothetical protein